jgi:hypothetical protein
MLKNQPPQIAPALKQGWYPKLVAITRGRSFLDNAGEWFSKDSLLFGPC